MFKKGDYIKVKEGTKLESGAIVNGWAGKIKEVNQKEKLCLVMFDAATINSLEDSYLIECLEEGGDPFGYIFDFTGIELSSRRDTDKEAKEASDKLMARIMELVEDEEEIQQIRKDKWVNDFVDSSYFEELTAIQKENVFFIIGTFMEYMYNYEYVEPEEWAPMNVQEVCLNIAPRKITAELEVFENYGDVLIPFFRFLGEEKYITNSLELAKTVEKIKFQIPIEADNPNNWGMAKSMMMSAQRSGIDVSDEAELNNFLMNQNANNIFRESPPGKVIPIKQDPYKKIGRNQKISVKYKDGRILTDIKFKKVESDLRNGLCEMMP